MISHVQQRPCERQFVNVVRRTLSEGALSPVLPDPAHHAAVSPTSLPFAPKVQPFYPRPPHFQEWLKEEAARISYDPSRRERVAAILERQNKSWDASPKTLANLERLRNGAAAVVTGQQVGLFGGPMFAIYKALTAVKLAEEASAAGVDAVPVFWLGHLRPRSGRGEPRFDPRTGRRSASAHHVEPRCPRSTCQRRAPRRRNSASSLKKPQTCSAIPRLHNFCARRTAPANLWARHSLASTPACLPSGA